MNPDAFWVAYKGPLAAVVDDFGVKFPRGEKVEVSPIVWAALRAGEGASQFEFSPVPESCYKNTSTTPSIDPTVPLSARHAPTPESSASPDNQAAAAGAAAARSADAAVADEPHPTRRFHISLNVGDLNKSIDFYRVLFGVEPSKCHDDYAKFDVADPPTVFSLVPGVVNRGGVLKRLSLRLASEGAVDEVKSRFEAAGLTVEAPREMKANYAQRYQFRTHDPDGNLWEIHMVKELIDANPLNEGEITPLESGIIATPPAEAETKAGLRIWEYHLSMAQRAPRPDEGPFDEVRMAGTMNGPLSTIDRQRLLAGAVQALKPGGRLELHGLFADRELEGAQPKLPGIASVVARVGTLRAAIEELRAAGLVSLQIVKLGVKPVFVHEGVPMREGRLAAYRPHGDAEAVVEVLYRGPFAAVRDDSGRSYRRGKKTLVSESVAKRLTEGPNSEQFSILQAQTAGSCG